MQYESRRISYRVPAASKPEISYIYLSEFQTGEAAAMIIIIAQICKLLIEVESKRAC